MNQEEAIKSLEKQGFRFVNWIPGEPDADGNPTDETRTAVMVRKPNRFTREYREVESDESIH